MHPLQQKIIDIARNANLASLKLRELGQLIGEPHPQKVKHHLNQLFKKGYLKKNGTGTEISLINPSDNDNLFISLPILGAANCGQALTIAEEYFEGYLTVSKSILPQYQPNSYFVVKCKGNSMNKAQIKGKSIEEGDYAVINRSQISNYENKYVLSIINGMANIKKLISNLDDELLVLISESTVDYPPIYIHKQDFEDSSYFINGEVVDIIKNRLLSKK